ncbi:ubiquinone anaerobic biosynthesis protein UbiV [Consotaella aegiceratis]|uniref:ubiquinone anaerobic biosynthesis protein UbiV n=1 Tax=Consotaella aegiceratis TaxID=3097961 RepID=UPI002F40B9D2
MTRIGLTLGPVLFNWSAERLLTFYRGIAEGSAYDRVHVGEVVCGKRAPFSDPVWPEVIEMLEAAGKDVVVSTLAMPSTPRERKLLIANAAGDQTIEINDITALSSLGGHPFVVGPFVNVYNEAAASFLAGRGARSICLPVELPFGAIEAIATTCPALDVEVFAFGRLPLALSSRCYHARHHGLHKDSCQFICDRDPDGLAVDTIDGQRFLAINGIQTMSHDVQVICPTAEEAASHGIARLRISPHTLDMVAVGGIYRRLLDDTIEPAQARAELAALDLPGRAVDGYVRGKAGCAAVETA